MDFSQLINHRQSCRNYEQKKVEQEKIITCLEAARMAPSACNSQPWKFIVVDEPALKEKIAKETHGVIAKFNKFSHRAPIIVVIVMEQGNFSSNLGTLLSDKEFAFIDLGIAVEHFCLQATELGLGTCILGWSNNKEIKRLLSIPKNKGVGLLITVGYPTNSEIRPKMRKKLEEMSEYNKYCK